MKRLVTSELVWIVYICLVRRFHSVFIFLRTLQTRRRENANDCVGVVIFADFVIGAFVNKSRLLKITSDLLHIFFLNFKLNGRL